jgi:tRNA (guanine6-N2)-methyltransferase
MWEVECEALPGLEELLEQELASLAAGPGLRFRFDGALTSLLELRIAQSVYLVLPVAAARPSALLGEEHLRRLLAAIDAVRRLHGPAAFASFRLGAAGQRSSTFQRLAAVIAQRTGLAYEPDSGDLLVRVRRARPRQAAPRSERWEALVRLTPRPLSARSWRVHNMPGALNASIAAAMVKLTRPSSEDRFANLLCGSGTLLIERLLAGPARRAVGVELDGAALEAARSNVAAARLASRVQLARADVGRLPLAGGTLDVLAADLPYGDRVGSHGDNLALYPTLLREAARVARPGARFVAITHDIRLLEACLREARSLWRVEWRLRVLQGGHRPQVTLLSREPAP